MKHPSRNISVPVAAVALVLLAGGAWAQSTMTVNGTPYYNAGYKVGLACSWAPVTGADLYQVTHSRQDACGSASVVVYTTATSSGSGTHKNCKPAEGCYSKSCQVEALQDAGSYFLVLATGSTGICATGCQSGNCPDCDSDGLCEPGEAMSCSDCDFPDPMCINGKQCNCPGDYGLGLCQNGHCNCDEVE